MTHLIKLELKKFGIAQNIIFMFAAILFSILFITISLWDSMTDPKQVKDTFESTYLVIGLLMSFIFLVYSSVLTAKLVIGEYNHRTITIMFSYPLNRIKLIASKLTIIMVYTAISMTIGYICCSSYIIFADKSFNMLEGTFQPSMLRTWIPMAITTVIICMVLSLWSFIIGMIRKSVPATIVTSLIWPRTDRSGCTVQCGDGSAGRHLSDRKSKGKGTSVCRRVQIPETVRRREYGRKIYNSGTGTDVPADDRSGKL